MLVILLPAMFSGCFGEEDIVSKSEEEVPAYPQPWERTDLTYDDSDVFSRVSVNGTHGIDTVRSVYVDVPTITAADGGAGLTGDAVTAAIAPRSSKLHQKEANYAKIQQAAKL